MVISIHRPLLRQKLADCLQRVAVCAFAIAIPAALFISSVPFALCVTLPLLIAPMALSPTFPLAPATLLMPLPAPLIAAVATLILPWVSDG
ncbi:hypothetical protein EBE87_13650 [Pseudoroseomonas wenyumeiae]|uniref:Uncharacterized protein n=1 Tax=Teichococcus wenyumeiae TaxID=2478470 RepID=A0A3A9JJ21_9PROT|nr:hypothetical protein D6Z83_08640 [Pseudoroseomonas wenyumeiae]RMI20861.1 hypothetical protein EBE87_13650 [Pseudoroseomonas wenyumeiae]